MKFDALWRRGGGVKLLTPDETGMGSAASSHEFSLGSLLAPLAPVVDWWLGELKEMMPPRLRRLFAERRLLVRASQKEVCIADPESTPAQEICHPLSSSLHQSPATGKAQQRCDLLLDSSLVLERELELPLDAENSLRRVLSFSMDRYTPFNDGDVLFDYRVIRRDTVNRKIALTLYVAPRDGVNMVINHLSGLGIAPARLDVLGAGSHRPAGVNLLGAEKRQASPGMGRGNRTLGLSVIFLSLAALVTPYIQRHQTAVALESEVEQLHGRLRQAEIDRKELDERIAHMQSIQAHTSAMPAMLDVLLELTRLMPDDAWAGQVAIKSGRVRLTGESGAASELLASLSNSAIFSDPKFEAPLTQNPKTGRERFVISLAIKGYSHGR